MPKAKPKEKHLHFAGYDFTSGPEGTVVHRPTPERAGSGFQPGERVEYRDVNLWQQGTVTGADGKWVLVRWDGRSFESREWAPNLRHVSKGSGTRHHATKKKSPAQLQREVDEVLAKPGSGMHPYAKGQRIMYEVSVGGTIKELHPTKAKAVARAKTLAGKRSAAVFRVVLLPGDVISYHRPGASTTAIWNSD
jgi:hypothetical protein